MFKPIAVILVAKFIGAPVSVQWGIGFLSVIGHCFSPFLKFEGGKGVATGVGVMALMLPVETAIAFGCWAITIKTTKISSLSSLTAAVVLVVASFILHPEIPYINSHAPIILIVAIIFYKHFPNIIRLIKREEKRIDENNH